MARRLKRCATIQETQRTDIRRLRQLCPSGERARSAAPPASTADPPRKVILPTQECHTTRRPNPVIQAKNSGRVQTVANGRRKIVGGTPRKNGTNPADNQVWRQRDSSISASTAYKLSALGRTRSPAGDSRGAGIVRHSAKNHPRLLCASAAESSHSG